jgi:hypothetical protein
MNKKLPILAAVSVLTLGLAGCMENHRSMMSKPEGKYSSTETATDTKGTTTVKTTTTEVVIDENGNRKEVITSKTSKDPKGLWNKTTTSKTSQSSEETK